MNIVTAPLALLFQPSTGSIMMNLAPAGGGGADPVSVMFWKGGVALTLVLFLGGIGMLLGKVPAGLQATLDKYQITTGSAGLAMMVIGALLYLGIGWVLVKKKDA